MAPNKAFQTRSLQLKPSEVTSQLCFVADSSHVQCNSAGNSYTSTPFSTSQESIGMQSNDYRIFSLISFWMIKTENPTLTYSREGSYWIV